MIGSRPETETEESVATAPERTITCRACGHEITRHDARISQNGSHVHTRMNPFGWVHEFGCFREAPGATVEGPATEEATWFPGYAWRFASCGSCGVHLGWRYEGVGTFFGLLLEKLVA